MHVKICIEDELLFTYTKLFNIIESKTKLGTTNPEKNILEAKRMNSSGGLNQWCAPSWYNVPFAASSLFLAQTFF